MSFYGQDLAYVHHQGFGDFSLRAGVYCLELLADAGFETGLVFDLGCGSGIWLRELQQAGYEAAGADISEEMLELARQQAPEAALQQASAYEADVPPCVAVTAFGEILSYRPAPLAPEPPVAELFEKVAAALDPRGFLLFDVLVASPGKRMHYKDWRAGDDWLIEHEVSEDPEQSLLTRQIKTFRDSEGQRRMAIEEHHLRVYSSDWIEQHLAAAGFSVKTMRRYGDMDLPPRRLAFECRRAG